jgi:hypothetical protein
LNETADGRVTRAFSCLEFMRNESRSMSERRAQWLGLLGLVTLVFSACEREVTQVPAPVCHVNQFRLCPADCGRAVEQCIEPGPHWGPCSCVVLDASYSVDAAVTDAADGSDAGAADAKDATADVTARDAADG